MLIKQLLIKNQDIANAINGLPAVNFDGTDDFLNVSSTMLNGLPGVTVFFVARSFSNPLQQSIIRGTPDGGVSFGFGQNSTGLSCSKWVNINKAWVGSWNPTQPILSIKNPVICSMRYQGTKLQGWGNGVEDGGPSAASGSLTDKTATALTGATIGVGDASGRLLNGNLGELILFNRGLNDTERKSVESYLSQKWGVSIS